MLLPCRSATGRIENHGFLSLANSSDYWAVLWNKDMVTSLGASSCEAIFNYEFGILIEGLSTGFSVLQVMRSIEEEVLQALGLPYRAVNIAAGRAQDRNFDTYSMLRITDAPERIETIVIESGETMGGVGEPPLPPLAPAVVNALVALTGRPIRELPLSRHRFA